MKNFSHVHATSLESAILLLDQGGSEPIAGGTDLLPRLKRGISAPLRLVNLKTVPGLDHVRFHASEGLAIGSLATLAAATRDPLVRANYPVLCMAVSAAATPQLRNMGTLGGNLLQDSRCWYYRGPFPCWLKGGKTCFAKEGENGHHALFGGGPCYTAHPSDPAPSLMALGAEVRVAGREGERTLALEDLFRIPEPTARRLTALQPSEIIVEVRVPPPEAGSRGVYLKAMERRTWGFALASVALQLAFEDGIVRRARVVLGGVAPVPWRAPGAEDALQGHEIDDRVIGEASELAVSGARPLRRNRYKIELVKGLMRQALERMGGR
jgi:xanthine dehydrogenase YagS FAD-binding subunit